MSTPPLTSLAATLAVLAGGEGARMGKPKSLLRIDGQPILRYLLDRMQWPGPTLLVTTPGREKPPGHESFDAEAVDPVAGEGPLRGLLTALDHARTPLVVVTTVDMPLLDRTHLQWLADRLGEESDAIGLMTRRNAGDGPRLEPLPAAFRVEAKQLARSRLAQGVRALYSLTREPALHVRDAPAEWGDDWWTNLNRPEDFDAFVSKYGRRE